jgi:hypothetical protein
MAKGSWAKNNYYAIYRGDEFLAHGFIQELSLLFNIAEKSIREMSYPSYYERVAKSPNPEKRLLSVKVDELTRDDLRGEHRKRR